jgi:hypothetical protein
MTACLIHLKHDRFMDYLRGFRGYSSLYPASS